MKKSKLIIFSSMIVILAFVTVFTVFKASENFQLSNDLEKGYEFTYQISGNSEYTEIDLEKAAQSLIEHAEIQGGIRPTIKLVGQNIIKLDIAGVDSVEKARAFISAEKYLSLRDANDNLILDASALVENPASVGFSNDGGTPVITLQFKDANTLYNATVGLGNEQNPGVLVLWDNFIEGEDSFEKEANKEFPKFLGAISISGAIDSTELSFLGNFTKSEAQKIATFINTLDTPVKITEKEYHVKDAIYGNEISHTYALIGSILFLLVMIAMIVAYKLSGLTIMINMAAFIGVTLFIFISLHLSFDIGGVSAFLLLLTTLLYKNLNLLKNIKTSTESTLSAKLFEVNKKENIYILPIYIVISVIIYLVSLPYLHNFSMVLLIGSLMMFIFDSLILKKILLPLLYQSELRHQYVCATKNKTSKIAMQLSNVISYKYVAGLLAGLIILGSCFMIYYQQKDQNPFYTDDHFHDAVSFVVRGQENVNQENIEKEFRAHQIAIDNIEIQDGKAYIIVNQNLSDNVLQSIQGTLLSKYVYAADITIEQPRGIGTQILNAIYVAVGVILIIFIYMLVRLKKAWALSSLLGIVITIFSFFSLFIIFRWMMTPSIFSTSFIMIFVSSLFFLFTGSNLYQKVANDKKEGSAEYYATVATKTREFFILSNFAMIMLGIIFIILLYILQVSQITYYISYMSIYVLVVLINYSIVIPSWQYLQTKMIKNGSSKQKKNKKHKQKELNETIIPGIND